MEQKHQHESKKPMDGSAVDNQGSLRSFDVEVSENSEKEGIMS